MNTLIVLACVLAAACANPGHLYNGLGAVGYSGAYASPLAYNGYAHAGHVGLASEPRLIDPVAIAAGAPLPTGDTVEVAAAKAAHLQAHAAATARNHGVYAHASPLAYSAGHYAHAAPLAYNGYAHATPLAYNGYAQATPLAYNGYAHAAPLALASEARLVDPVAIAAGAPLPTGDTVEVAAAKAAHFQAHAVARSNHFLRYKRGLAAIAYGAHPIAHSAVAYPSAHHAVAYNAPLVAAPHPVAHHVAYSAPIVHHAAPVHHAVYAPALSHATSYSSVSHVSHPLTHYAGAYAHHY